MGTKKIKELEQGTTSEEQTFRDAYNTEIVREKRLANDKEQQYIDFQKDLLKWIKKVVKWWLIFTAFSVACYFIFNACFGREIASAVMCMLLGTTTVNIIGLGVIVLKDVFPKNQNSEQ